MDISAQEGITDARELGMSKYIILGVQHLFAMFGATVLVPVLTGLLYRQLCCSQVLARWFSIL